jgi:HEAT repeat protein
MQHVFISFKHEDLDFADNVISRLEKEGFTTWADFKIGAGEEWRNAIDLAIKNAFALIVIMTPEAKASEYVTYEWAFAWGVGIRVIPIMLRSTPLHPRLEALQYLDFTSMKSRPWERLIEEVRDASHAPLTHSISIPLNSPPFIRQAVASLDSAVLADRTAAIETLTTAGTSGACTVLREALKHPLPDVRFSAANALGRIKDSAAVPDLIEALKDPDGRVHYDAANALGRIKDSAAVPALIEALKNPNGGGSISAAEALGAIKDPAAVPALIEALKDPGKYVRSSAAKALGAIKDSAAVPALIEVLKDPDDYVRSSAAEALGAIKDPAAVSALREVALKDPNNLVRSTAAEALEGIEDSAAGEL